MRVLVFGASTASGCWDKEGGWVDRLKRFLNTKTIEEAFYCLTYNLCISGDNTNDILRRMRNEIEERKKEEPEEMIFIFSIGTNDTQFLLKEQRVKVSKDEFKDNIKKIIEIARKYSSKIVVVSPYPVDDSKLDPIPWDPIKCVRTDLIKEYAQILRNFCLENNLPFIDIFDKIDKTMLYEDGLHINTKGHKKIFEIVRDLLIEKKII